MCLGLQACRCRVNLGLNRANTMNNVFVNRVSFQCVVLAIKIRDRKQQNAIQKRFAKQSTLAGVQWK